MTQFFEILGNIAGSLFYYSVFFIIMFGTISVAIHNWNENKAEYKTLIQDIKEYFKDNE